MMLQPRDHNLVIFADVLPTPTLRHKIDRFRGATYEDNLFS
jgi:hypothetical protein